MNAIIFVLLVCLAATSNGSPLKKQTAKEVTKSIANLITNTFGQDKWNEIKPMLDQLIINYCQQRPYPVQTSNLQQLCILRNILI
jgi:hypothetical protein